MEAMHKKLDQLYRYLALNHPKELAFFCRFDTWALLVTILVSFVVIPGLVFSYLRQLRAFNVRKFTNDKEVSSSSIGAESSSVTRLRDLCDGTYLRAEITTHKSQMSEYYVRTKAGTYVPKA